MSRKGRKNEFRMKWVDMIPYEQISHLFIFLKLSGYPKTYFHFILNCSSKNFEMKREEPI